MGILRSEQMKHGTLVLPIDRARQFIDIIGASTKMQFEDMNARDMHRPYKKYIQRIDEMERILRFLLDELTRVPGATVIKNQVDSFLDNTNEYKLDEIEKDLKRIYKDFVQFKENNSNLTEKRNGALEARYVVQTAMASMAQMQPRQNQGRGMGEERFEFQASRALLDDTEGGGTSRRGLETMFSNVAGVIPQADQDRFARTLFRATRGNTFTHFQQIYEPMRDPKTGGEVHKSVFVVYFQDHRVGASVSAMSEKVNKICASYGVNTYHWPSTRESAQEMMKSLDLQVADQRQLLEAHDNFVRSEAAMLLEPARLMGNSLIEEWRMFCKKEKAIYAALNLFEGDMNLRASCWYPAAEEDHIRSILIGAGSGGPGRSSAMLVSDRTPPRSRPPTYIRRNEFTGVFQELVDTYGLPRYGEANPALFTVVTFPFLFGVMFGDVGHGLMLLIVGSYALWKADELKHSVPFLHEVRYILFMMGFFAVYMGFLYNDFFSVGLTFFESRWQPGSPVGSIVTYTAKDTFDTKNMGGAGPYPFGVDPAWHGAQNELIYMNSMKMKLSVILGVTQMIAGLILRFANSLNEKNMVNFFCECIPMMVFMVCFFGFMDYMILYKWVYPVPDPPSIINSLIAMAMFDTDPNPMFGNEVPRTLMICCMLTVPFMLVPKPVCLYLQHKQKTQAAASSSRHIHQGGGSRPIGHVTLGDEESCRLSSCEEEAEEEFDIADIAIHQIIETIEYVLGTVSHTASYLRLWALSLAHQQLSVVFFNMTLVSAMEASFPLNMFAVYIWFAVWFAITLGILLGMDVLECFLHTLRLHWVEFQSKFYRADGYAFEPFCHRALVEKAE